MKKRGVSLAEALIAIFMLVLALVVVSAILVQSSQLKRQANFRVSASRLARDRLEQVRNWAQTSANFRSDWSAVVGITTPMPGYVVDFTLETSTRLYAPCTQMETSQPDARALNRSLRQGLVTCTWPNSGNQRVILRAAFSAPERQVRAVQPIVITRGTGPVDPIPPNQAVDFTAQLLDVNDQVIEDCFFDWEIQPLSGNGTVTKGSRDGRTGRLSHRFTRNGLTRNISGQVRVLTHTRYWGRSYEARTDPVVLQ